MRLTLVATIGLAASLGTTAALAADTAPPAPTAAASAAAARMTTAETSLGDLLDNPTARAVLSKHAPTLTEGGQIEQARPLTLKALQQYAPDLVPDTVLAKIDADLAGPASGASPAAAPAAPATMVHMTTAETSLGDLLDNAAARDILTKHAPTLTAGGQIEQARPLTLKALQQYAPDLVPDTVLAKIDADLAALPSTK